MTPKEKKKEWRRKKEGKGGDLFGAFGGAEEVQDVLMPLTFCVAASRLPLVESHSRTRS